MEGMNTTFTWHITREERTGRGKPRDVTTLCGARTLNLACLTHREALSRAFPDLALCPRCRDQLNNPTEIQPTEVQT